MTSPNFDLTIAAPDYSPTFFEDLPDGALFLTNSDNLMMKATPLLAYRLSTQESDSYPKRSTVRRVDLRDAAVQLRGN